MSVQFGKWNFTGQDTPRFSREEIELSMSSFAQDRICYHSEGNVVIAFGALPTTPEAITESQPFVTSSGAVLCFDGRLDNRQEMLELLGNTLNPQCADAEIVASAYERWGRECFRKLLGDWAISIWDARARSLLLAKDFLGSRSLYYLVQNEEVAWSTSLGALISCTHRQLAIDEEFVAGWLSFFPATHLTPYRGICSVPPSSFVLIIDRDLTVKKYWDFDSSKAIRYRSDSEYEDQLRHLLRRSVERRLRSASPILAELSGGMDSSSIVCVADSIVGTSESPESVDTISYFNDTDPNWDERPFVAIVESKRGRPGWHIDVSAADDLGLSGTEPAMRIAPGFRRPTQSRNKFQACRRSGGYRVILSGIGGDEVLGGVPSPIPELADLLVRANFRDLTRRLAVWSIYRRQPWFQVLLQTGKRFLSCGYGLGSQERKPAPWLTRDFVRAHRFALRGYPQRFQVFGPLPSFQDRAATLDDLRRQLTYIGHDPEPLIEKRYAYLDRELLEFLFAIPADQLVRPGQRRSLMRRALAGTVPDALLNRPRKAFATRGPRSTIARNWTDLETMSRRMIATSLGIVDEKAFLQALREAKSGTHAPLVPLMRTIGLEMWLRTLPGVKESRFPEITATSAANTHVCFLSQKHSSAGEMQHRKEVNEHGVREA